MSHSIYRGLSVAAGILVAAVTLEIGLRAFATAGPPPVPRIAHDAFDDRVVVSRQMDEGIASSQFSSAGARLTGNAIIPGAPVLVLVGDSYVVAREVTDEETMGSRVERLARAGSHDLNVRQYGWRGASAAQYLSVAKEIRQRWNPHQVVVVLSEDDLGADALNRNFPRMAIDKSGKVSVVHAPATLAANADREPVTSSSVLAGLLRARWQRVLARMPNRVQRLGGAVVESRGPIPDSSLVARVPRATVQALAEAFGPDLAIIYVADVRVRFGQTSGTGEVGLLDACAVLQVRCLSTRNVMLAARTNGVIARGFPTTTLGIGHLNAAGHELIAGEIWTLLRPAYAVSASK